MKTTTNITMKTPMVYNLGMAETCTALSMPLCHCFKPRPIAVADRTSSQGRLLDTLGIRLMKVGGFSPYPSEKYDGVSNSWDDEIPNIWKVIKFHGSKTPTR